MIWQRFTGTKSGRPFYYAYVGGHRVAAVVWQTAQAHWAYPRGAYAVSYRGRPLGWIGTVAAAKRIVENAEQFHTACPADREEIP